MTEPELDFAVMPLPPPAELVTTLLRLAPVPVASMSTAPEPLAVTSMAALPPLPPSTLTPLPSVRVFEPLTVVCWMPPLKPVSSLL